MSHQLNSEQQRIPARTPAACIENSQGIQWISPGDYDYVWNRIRHYTWKSKRQSKQWNQDWVMVQKKARTRSSIGKLMRQFLGCISNFLLIMLRRESDYGTILRTALRRTKCGNSRKAPIYIEEKSDDPTRQCAFELWTQGPQLTKTGRFRVRNPSTSIVFVGLASLNLSLFYKLRTLLSGIRFRSIEEVIDAAADGYFWGYVGKKNCSGRNHFFSLPYWSLFDLPPNEALATHTKTPLHKESHGVAPSPWRLHRFRSIHVATQRLVKCCPWCRKYMVSYAFITLPSDRTTHSYCLQTYTTTTLLMMTFTSNPMMQAMFNFMTMVRVLHSFINTFVLMLRCLSNCSYGFLSKFQWSNFA